MADPTIVNDFTPVVTSDFTPTEQPISTVTGKPEPTSEEAIQSGKDVAAGAVRYGVPIAAGIVNPSLALPNLIMQALTVTGSEFAARRIERAESDPELDTLWNDLKASGVTGLLDLGVNLATRGIGSAIRRVGQKLFIPSEIPLEIRTAQQVLGEIPDEPMKQPGVIKRFKNFVTGNNAKRPFSLTYGQINAEEQRFIGWLEGIARAGVGSRGVMSTFDLRNEDAVRKLIQQYITERATEATGPEFAVLAKRIIGDVSGAKTGKGEMFLPVEAYRKFLYTQFEKALGESGSVVDGAALRSFIMNNEAAEEGLTQKVYGTLRSEGLVPPLKAPTTTRRSVTTTSTKKVGQEAINETQDITRTNLLTGKETRKAETAVGERASATKGTTQTVKESTTVAGMTEEELAQEWANLPAADVDKIIKTINAHWEDDITRGKQSKRINRILSRMKEKIEPKFEKSMGRDVAKLRNDANTFFGKEQDFMHDAAINAFRRTLSRNPSKSMALLGGGTTSPNAKVVYDRLISLKKALQFSAETPRVGEALSKAVSEGGFPAGREAMQKMYEESFLEPLRYRMIINNVDPVNPSHFDPDGFLKMLSKNADVPEYFEEVFGGPAQVERIKRLMTALSVLKQKGPEKNIFIQLAQAGAIGGALGGGLQAVFSDDISVKGPAVGAGVAILLGPYALSKMLTNSTTIRAFTDGISQGARSGRFAMSLRKIAEMKTASTFFRDQPSADAVGYYTSMEPK